MRSKTTNTFSPEARERAVRMRLEHEGEHPSRWAAMGSIADKIGRTARPLNAGTGRPTSTRASEPAGDRTGVQTDVAEKTKALERENRELREANEILRKASACAPTKP